MCEKTALEASDSNYKAQRGQKVSVNFTNSSFKLNHFFKTSEELCFCIILKKNLILS